MVPVHKKNDKTVAKNYRPVSMLPVLSKVLESIVASRVTVHLEKHHLLCTRQFGFRPGRSAADLHLLLTSEWNAALDAGKVVTVSPRGLENVRLAASLEKCCFTPNLCNLVFYYIFH